jgi:hypothetical protein
MSGKISDYTEQFKTQLPVSKFDKKTMIRNNGLSKSIDTMSKEEIKKIQQAEVFSTIEKDGRNNRRRMVYSNDIYKLTNEEKKTFSP